MPSTSPRFLAALAAGALVAAPAAFLAASLAGSGAPRAHAAATDDGHTIATCAIIEIINELMSSDRFEPDRVEFERQIKEDEMGPLIAQGRDLEERLRTLDPESDESKQLQAQILQLRDRLGQMQQQAGIRYERFTVKQSIEAYQLVRASAAAVAEDLGFDYVLTSSDPERELEEMPMTAFRNEILSRTVIHRPEGVDISDDVRADLNLE